MYSASTCLPHIEKKKQFHFFLCPSSSIPHHFLNKSKPHLSPLLPPTFSLLSQKSFLKISHAFTFNSLLQSSFLPHHWTHLCSHVSNDRFTTLQSCHTAPRISIVAADHFFLDTLLQWFLTTCIVLQKYFYLSTFDNLYGRQHSFLVHYTFPLLYTNAALKTLEPIRSSATPIRSCHYLEHSSMYRGNLPDTGAPSFLICSTQTVLPFFFSHSFPVAIP